MLLVSNAGPFSSNNQLIILSINSFIAINLLNERSRSMSSENKVQYDIDSLKNLHKRSQGGPKNRAEAH